MWWDAKFKRQSETPSSEGPKWDDPKLSIQPRETEVQPLNVRKADDGTFVLTPKGPSYIARSSPLPAGFPCEFEDEIVAAVNRAREHARQVGEQLALNQERKFLDLLAGSLAQAAEDPQSEARNWEAAMNLPPYTVLDGRSETFAIDAFLKELIDGELWAIHVPRWFGAHLQHHIYARGMQFMSQASLDYRAEQFIPQATVFEVPAFPVEDLQLLEAGPCEYGTDRESLLQALEVRLQVAAEILDQEPVTDRLTVDRAGHVGLKTAPGLSVSHLDGDWLATAGGVSPLQAAWRSLQELDTLGNWQEGTARGPRKHEPKRLEIQPIPVDDTWLRFVETTVCVCDPRMVIRNRQEF